MNLKYLIKGFCILGISSLALIACNKDNDVVVPEKVQKLMNKNWSVKTVEVIEPTSELTSIYKQCMSDDILKFTTTYYEFTDGATACDSTILPYFKSAFSLDTVNDTLYLQGKEANKIHKFKIQKLTADSLVLRWNDVKNNDTIKKVIGLVAK